MNERVRVPEHSVEDRCDMASSPLSLRPRCTSMVDVECKLEHTGPVVVQRLKAKQVVWIDVSGVDPTRRGTDGAEVSEHRAVNVQNKVERLTRRCARQRVAEQRHERPRDPLVQTSECVVAVDLDGQWEELHEGPNDCLLYTSPSPRDLSTSRMPSSA